MVWSKVSGGLSQTKGAVEEQQPLFVYQLEMIISVCY